MLINTYKTFRFSANSDNPHNRSACCNSWTYLTFAQSDVSSFIIAIVNCFILSFLIFQIYDRPADNRIILGRVVAIAVDKVDEPLGI